MRGLAICTVLAASIVWGLTSLAGGVVPRDQEPLDANCLDPDAPLPRGTDPVVLLGDRDGSQWKAVVAVDATGGWVLWMPVQGLGVCMIAAGDEMEIDR
jgi:hypothetical protein